MSRKKLLLLHKKNVKKSWYDICFILSCFVIQIPWKNHTLPMKTQLTIIDYLSRAQPEGTRVSHREPFENGSLSAQSFAQILSAASGETGPNEEQPINNMMENGCRLGHYLKNRIKARSYGQVDVKAAQKAYTDNTPPENMDAAGLKAGAPGALPKSVQSDIRPETSGQQASHRQNIDACIEKAARKYNVDKSLIAGIVRAESAFQPDAVSAAGAQGLMQLMPGTARELGVDDPFDIQQNIDGGVRYFRQMMDRFDGDVKLALAAYNAGPGTVRRYDGIPPYAETRHYVAKVMKFAHTPV